MSTLTLLCGVAALVVLLALALRAKFRADAITQDGVRVGSALIASVTEAIGGRARFIIIRGMPTFRESDPFVYRGVGYRIDTVANYDVSSSVLRRFLDVTCDVVAVPTVGR